jgi:hypothetical protein
MQGLTATTHRRTFPWVINIRIPTVQLEAICPAWVQRCKLCITDPQALPSRPGSHLVKLIYDNRGSGRFAEFITCRRNLQRKHILPNKINVTFHWSPSAVYWICNRPTVKLRTTLAGYNTTKLTHPHKTQQHISQMYFQLEHIGYWPQTSNSTRDFILLPPPSSGLRSFGVLWSVGLCKATDVSVPSPRVKQPFDSWRWERRHVSKRQ